MIRKLNVISFTYGINEYWRILNWRKALVFKRNTTHFSSWRCYSLYLYLCGWYKTTHVDVSQFLDQTWTVLVLNHAKNPGKVEKWATKTIEKRFYKRPISFLILESHRIFFLDFIASTKLAYNFQKGLSFSLLLQYWELYIEMSVAGARELENIPYL